MEIDIVAFLTAVSFVGYVGYNSMKIHYIKKELNEKLLTPQEMAKEVIKVKLPLSDVPEDVKEKLREMATNGGLGLPPFGSPSTGKPPSNIMNDTVKPDYMG